MSLLRTVLLAFAGFLGVWILFAWVWGGSLLLRQWWTRFVLRRAPEPDPPPIDGFGQTLLQDLAYRRRFRSCRKQETVWRAASFEEQQSYGAHPVLGRFGDFTIAMAEVDGRVWVVRERIWHGWPDPPEWVFFAMENDTIWAAGDFDAWPRRWTQPDEQATSSGSAESKA